MKSAWQISGNKLCIFCEFAIAAGAHASGLKAGPTVGVLCADAGCGGPLKKKIGASPATGNLSLLNAENTEMAVFFMVPPHGFNINQHMIIIFCHIKLTHVISFFHFSIFAFPAAVQRSIHVFFAGQSEAQRSPRGGRSQMTDFTSSTFGTFLVNLAVKLLRTFAAQTEALQRYRGKGQQKITVEHVHVHSGGQAIVGSVSQSGGGRDNNENRGQPHAPENAVAAS